MTSGGSHDEDNNSDNGDNSFDVPAKKGSKARGYHSCAGEFKRLLVKWGNVPRVLQHVDCLQLVGLSKQVEC